MFECAEPTDILDVILRAERDRLVGLCAHLTGDIDVAQDLAQETLLEAWRQREKLIDLAGCRPWLSAIARNVCLRWRSRQMAEARRLTDGTQCFPWQDTLADAIEIESELERRELSDLLGRALAQLPAATRVMLVERYVHGVPYRQIAERLGLSEGAVKMRLRRGKQLLQVVLATALREESVAHGVIPPEPLDWRETHIWCPECGRRRLLGRFPHALGGAPYQLRCPDCHPAPDVYFVNVPVDRYRELCGPLKGYKPALERVMAWTNDFYFGQFADGLQNCPHCKKLVVVQRFMPEDSPPSIRDVPGVHARCSRCGYIAVQGLMGLVLALPQARRFWRQHAQIRTILRDEVETEGQPARVVRVERLTGGVGLDVIVGREMRAVIGIHEAGSV